mgnify:FL=1
MEENPFLLLKNRTKLEQLRNFKIYININIMPKEKEYKFTNQSDFNETLIDMSFKRAVKRIQNKIKEKKIHIDYISKKGKPISRWIPLPIGRKKKLGN